MEIRNLIFVVFCLLVISIAIVPISASVGENPISSTSCATAVILNSSDQIRSVDTQSTPVPFDGGFAGYINAVFFAPEANFTADVTNGTVPLLVSFTDLSINAPTGRAWYFGDENYTGPWTRATNNAEWTHRYGHNSVVMPDGSIVLMGGYDGTSVRNDTWRSTDKGSTWIQMNASAGWLGREWPSSVTLADGSIVLMGGGTIEGVKNDVWRSADNGATWSLVNASAGWAPRDAQSSVVMPDGSIVLMGGGNGISIFHDVWRSMDSGLTWMRVNASPGWTAGNNARAVTMSDGSIIIAGGEVNYAQQSTNEVWRSTDSGSTWALVNANVPRTNRISHQSVVMPDNSILMMGGYDGNILNDVVRSTDYGATWVSVNASAGWQGRGSFSSVVTPDGTVVIMGGTTQLGGFPVNDVWRFNTAGSSEMNPTHTYTNSGKFSVALQVYNSAGYNSSRKVRYIETTGSSPTVDFSANTTSGEAPLPVLFSDTSLNATGRVWYFGDDRYTSPWIKATNSAEWAHRYGHNSVVMPDGSIILMGGYDGTDVRNDVWRSTDEGSTWTLVNASAGWLGREWPSSVAMQDGSILLMGGGTVEGVKNDVWRSADKGVTWTLVNASAGWSPRDGQSSVVLPDGSIVLMGGGDGGSIFHDVWRSMDSGLTWTWVNASPGWTAGNNARAVTMPDGSIVLMDGEVNYNHTSSNEVWRSTDSGSTWTLVNAQAPGIGRISHQSVVMPDNSILMMGGYDGNILNDVVRSTNYGATWVTVNASAGWQGRGSFSSVVTPDGTVVIMGGTTQLGGFPVNDVWRFNPAGASELNPTHTYSQPGNYSVTLQAYNSDGYNSTRKIGYINVTGKASKIGVFRPSTRHFYIDYNGNGAWNGVATDKSYSFGSWWDIPVTGEWNNDRITKIGVFRQSTHEFYLDYNGNGEWNRAPIDRSFNFGLSSDTPISGDWNNDGRTEIGIFRQSTHQFYLDYNGNGAWSGATTDRSCNFGLLFDIPLTGDWNNDGISEIGVFRPSTHRFYLDYNGNGAWNGAVTDRSYNFGLTGDIPVTGDWNLDGITEIGVFRPSTHMFYLDYNGNGAWNGAITDRSYNFGLTGDRPVAGKWN